MKSDFDANVCNCLPNNRIPLSRISFFKSQLFDRETKELIKISDLPIEDTIENMVEGDLNNDSDDGDFIDDERDGNYEPEPEELAETEEIAKPKSTPKNLYEYPETVSALRRCKVSYWYGFEILSSQLLDLRSHAPPEIQAFLDKHFLSPTKLQNMDKRYGKERAEKHLKNGFFPVLGVDGKKSDVRQKHGRFLKQDKQVIIGTSNKLISFILKI